MARTIVYEPIRFSQVPWLLDAADLRPCLLPSSTVEHGERVTMGWYISDPFGRDTSRVLRVSTPDWRSEDVTLSISEHEVYQAPDPPKRTTKAYVMPDDNGANEIDED